MQNQPPNKQKNAPKRRKDSTDYIDSVSAGAGSSGDMTGLIPAAPADGHELDSYRELFSHEPQARKQGSKKDF